MSPFLRKGGDVAARRRMIDTRSRAAQQCLPSESRPAEVTMLSRPAGSTDGEEIG